MRRRDREVVDRSEIDAIIRGSEVCRLGFAVGGDPYVVPVSFGYDGDALYFHTARAGRKIDLLETNPRICFEMDRGVELRTDAAKPCDWTFHYESVIGYGHAKELVEPRDRQRGLDQVMLQYSGRTWEYDAAAMARIRVWRLDVDTVTGKRSAK